jgi:hypothetical protein
MDAREPLNLKRIRRPIAAFCAAMTIPLLAAGLISDAAGAVPLSEIPPRAYVVATYNGSMLRVYVNAVPEAEGVVTGLTDPTKSPLEIGSYAGSAIWSGAVDEVAVYGRALPAVTITAHYRLGTDERPPGPDAYRDAVLATAGLVSYWRLDNLGAVAIDSRGHNNGVFTAGVSKGVPGLITGEPDKAISLNGHVGSVQVPPSPSLDLRRAFTLEAWVTTVSVANRHIVSRVGSWFLKTDSFGRWNAGVYVKGAAVSAVSRLVAHGPQSAASAPLRSANRGSSSSALWIVIGVALAGLAIAFARRTMTSRR